MPNHFLKPVELAFRRAFLRGFGLLCKTKKSTASIPPEELLARFGPSPSILLLRQDRLGDVIMSSFVLRALRERFPASRIALLLGKNNVGIVPLLPTDCDLFIYSKNLSKDIGMLRSLRKRRFDIAIDLTDKASVTSTILLGASGAQCKIGVDKENAPVYDITVQHLDMEQYHVARRNAELLRSLGFDPDALDLRPELNLLANPINGRVGFNVSARVPARCAPSKASAEIARGLVEMGCSEVVIFVAPDDHERGREIVDSVHDERVHLAPLVRSFAEFAEQVASCEYLITTDTSTTQIAAAAGVPALVLFTPTPGEHLWTPVGIPFEPYTQYPTLAALEPQPVLELFKQLMVRSAPTVSVKPIAAQ